jgi:hypothetical protein
VVVDVPQVVFERAISSAAASPLDGWQWYPFSYLSGHLLRQAKFLEAAGSRESAAAESSARLNALALERTQEALRWLGNTGGAAVLRKYRCAECLSVCFPTPTPRHFNCSRLSPLCIERVAHRQVAATNWNDGFSAERGTIMACMLSCVPAAAVLATDLGANGHGDTVMKVVWLPCAW